MKEPIQHKENNCILMSGSILSIMDAHTHRLRRVLARHHMETEYVRILHHDNGDEKKTYIRWKNDTREVSEWVRIHNGPQHNLVRYEDSYGNLWKKEWGISFPYYKYYKSFITLMGFMEANPATQRAQLSHSWRLAHSHPTTRTSIINSTHAEQIKLVW